MMFAIYIAQPRIMAGHVMSRIYDVSILRTMMGYRRSAQTAVVHLASGTSRDMWVLGAFLLA